MKKEYILNLETNHIELHFEKSDYQALSTEQKRELKNSYLWSKVAGAWVSRSTKNHYSAINTAEKLGFYKGEKVGEKLSFEEELQRKAEKAEHRAERFEQYAENANNRASQLQKEFNDLRGDWSFVTQPNINSSAGRRFTAYRDKIMNRYEKGYEEYRKSDYFKEKAITAEQTASMEQLKNPVYLDNRIKECNKRMKKLQQNIIHYEQIIYNKENNTPNNFNSYSSSFYDNKTIEEIQEYLNECLEKLEYQIDKLSYLENCMDDAGGVQYNKDNIKPGYLVKIRGRWDLVLKANKTTVQTKSGVCTLELTYPYAEIQDMKIPEGWTEKEKIKNPFVNGEILVRTAISENRIIKAFQVVKTTSKTITMQEVEVKENIPIVDSFKSEKQEKRKVIQDRSGNFVVNDDGDWYLYKYTPVKEEAIV